MHSKIELNCSDCYSVKYGYKACNFKDQELGFGYPKSMFIDSVDKFQKENGITYVSERNNDLWIKGYFGGPLVALANCGYIPDPICFRCDWRKCIKDCFYYNLRDFISNNRPKGPYDFSGA
jgi:hypothetical protein